jgi:hypothetical protein
MHEDWCWEVRRTVYDTDDWPRLDEHVSFHATEAEAEAAADRLAIAEGFDAFQVRELI